MAFFVPTRFTWRFGGQVVHLCGSFTRWVETVPMLPLEGSPGVFSVVVHLPPGYHQYKFIVDGEWRHDETQPFMPDPLGNVNNWLFVRRPETQTQPVPIPQSAQSAGHHAQHAQQQQQPGADQLPQHAQQAQLAAQQSSAAQQAQQQQRQHQPYPQQNHSRPPAVLPSQQNQLPPAQSQTGGTGLAGDVDMHNADGLNSDGVLPPALLNEEPGYTRKKIRDFLHSHTAYELIPESGKVVLLDTELPIRQAFHALHDQGVASAPLWDLEAASVTGMISASDFIHILRQLRSSVSSGGNPMSEAEMDQHTIRAMREVATTEGREPKPLVYVRPEDHLGTVIMLLFNNRCSMAPVLSCEALGSEPVCTMLHIATISGVLACLMRHFRASLASLPLLSQPIGRLPVGTWSVESALARQEAANNGAQEGEERRDRRKVRPLHVVHPQTALTSALGLLLEAGVSALPVVDETGVLLDMYARSDITMLAKGNSYNRLQWEEVTVGQALALANAAPSSWPAPAGSSAQPSPRGEGPGIVASKPQRVFYCSARDSLRLVVERLSMPGVRRLFVVDDNRRVEGIVSLSDVAAFLFL
ncbi:hypothetical protein WJX72_008237 [[Myrmecia] bisecta]|uniref:CBS domain-containing protein n=1 Tax=[Myrmecia] bisecta TaxID=41462 RepID=A0AAW1P4X2_9CHLO